MIDAAVFHSRCDLIITPIVSAWWNRPLLELLLEAGAAGGFGNDPYHACGAFVAWCGSRNGVAGSVGNIDLFSVPGAAFSNDTEFDRWAWYDQVMADFASWTPPPLLVDLDNFLITRGGVVVWPDGRQKRLPWWERSIRLDGEPFPCGWLGPLTRDYFATDGLPAIRRPLNGTFDWLTPEKVAEDQPGPVFARMSSALGKLLSAGLSLPADFVTFFRSPRLVAECGWLGGWQLDLDTSGVIRKCGGWLVRFLSEEQGCGYVSLFVSPCQNLHRIVHTYHYSSSRHVAHPRDIVIVALSFEEFLYRFWLEKRIRSAQIKGLGLMPSGGTDYLARFNL